MNKHFRSFINGFQITFDNGWTVSVMWEPMNYCGDGTAETAHWYKNAETHPDAIRVYQTPSEVAATIAEIERK